MSNALNVEDIKQWMINNDADISTLANMFDVGYATMRNWLDGSRMPIGVNGLLLRYMVRNNVHPEDVFIVSEPTFHFNETIKRVHRGDSGALFDFLNAKDEEAAMATSEV